MFKAIKFFKTALRRQVAEAVRIRRRGGEGAILNSKGEYNRCEISRLSLEQSQGTKDANITEEEPGAMDKVKEGVDQWEEELSRGREEALREHRRALGAPTMSYKDKRKDTLPQPQERRTKRRKFELLREDWGEEGGREEGSQDPPRTEPGTQEATLMAETPSKVPGGEI